MLEDGLALLNILAVFDELELYLFDIPALFRHLAAEPGLDSDRCGLWLEEVEIQHGEVGDLLLGGDYLPILELAHYYIVLAKLLYRLGFGWHQEFSCPLPSSCEHSGRESGSS